MKKVILIFSIIVSSIALAAVVIMFFLKDNIQQAKIERAIVAANYCTQTSDCVVLPAECPFGCYVAVNKQERDQIQSMIQNFPSRCAYSCIQIHGAECANNTCQLTR